MHMLLPGRLWRCLNVIPAAMFVAFLTYQNPVKAAWLDTQQLLLDKCTITCVVNTEQLATELLPV